MKWNIAGLMFSVFNLTVVLSEKQFFCPDVKIVGGKNAKKGQFPYQVIFAAI